jgi:YbbR domain-containing protein
MNAFLRNLRTLLLAFVLALAVWVSAVTSADPDVVRAYPRAIPLEIVGQDPSLVIVGTVPDRINLSLRAPNSVWEQLNTADEPVRAVMDLSGMAEGQHHVDIQVQVRVQPARIVSIAPQTVDLTLETLATKTFPVNLALTGEPAVGYKTGTASISPTEVTVSGPQSALMQVQMVRADLNITGLRQDAQVALPLRLLDAAGQPVSGLTSNPESAQVHLPITQQGGYRDIAVKVVVHGQVADGYRLTNISVYPPVLTVYSGDPHLVNTLPGYVETEPLNLNGVSQNIETRLGFNLPSGISVVGEQTAQVQVGISAIEGSLSLNNMTVEVLGLADGLQAHISPPTVDVILTGPLPLLDKLTAGDVKIIVDLTGLTVGIHQLTPQAQIIIADVKIQSVNPATIEVTIAPASGALTPSRTPTLTPTPTATPRPF